MLKIDIKKSCIINHRQFHNFHALIIFERITNWWVPVDSCTPNKNSTRDIDDTQFLEWNIFCVRNWMKSQITLKKKKMPFLSFLAWKTEKCPFSIDEEKKRNSMITNRIQYEGRQDISNDLMCNKTNEQTHKRSEI